MSANNYSQLERGARINPINRRPRGLWANWADTAMSVRCMDILQDGSTEEHEFETNGPYISEFLIFSNDFPIITRPFSFYDTPTAPVLGNFPSFPEQPLIFDGTHFLAFGNFLYTTSQLSPVGPKGGIYGDTLTNKVSVSGFAAWTALTYRNLVQDTKTLGPRLEFDITTNGAVIAGRYPYMALTQVAGDAILPCFLRESDYTEEIAEHDNIYTYSAGGLTTVLAVCGLFAQGLVMP
jgi:hypothetical protein